MDRRSFLKIAMISSAGAGMLFKSNLSPARGISSKAFSGIAPDKCYIGPPKGVILTSLTDMFKIGPGPSSSHTIAPLRISSNFRKAMEDLPKDIMDKAQSIEVRLFGSLSATGSHHGHVGNGQGFARPV